MPKPKLFEWDIYDTKCPAITAGYLEKYPERLRMSWIECADDKEKRKTELKEFLTEELRKLGAAHYMDDCEILLNAVEQPVALLEIDARTMARLLQLPQERLSFYADDEAWKAAETEMKKRPRYKYDPTTHLITIPGKQPD